MASNPVDLDLYRREIASKAEQLATRSSEHVASGGGPGGPRDPNWEKRVSTLENDMREIKTSLKALELSTTRIEAVLAHVPTKADLATTNGNLATISERLRASEERAGRIEKAVDGALAASIGKSIGWWQFPLILGGSAAVLTAAAAALSWLMARGYFPHSP